MFSVFQISDPRAREGVSHQPLPHPAETDRDGSPALPHRAADQNLVPKQVSNHAVFAIVVIVNGCSIGFCILNWVLT